jgi:predicted nucleic acid-binding protein
MSILHLKHTHILLDTCCLINLHTSTILPAILETLPMQVMVAETVRGECSSFSLEPYIEMGILQLVDFVETETNQFFGILRNAVGMGDGEAAVGAIAMNRNWGIAIDDKRARNYFKLHAPHIQLISTPEIILHWATKSNADFHYVQEIIQKINIEGRFRLHNTHPLYPWWKQYV